MFSHRMGYVTMNLFEKILKSLEVLEKISGHFYEMRHVMASIYVLAACRLRIEVPSSQILISQR